MNILIEEITKLTEEWYKLIKGDHHKDRDCHWYIEVKWSYGNPPKYIVMHYGYILKTIKDEYSTYEEALKGLKDTMIFQIKQYQTDGEIDFE